MSESIKQKVLILGSDWATSPDYKKERELVGTPISNLTDLINKKYIQDQQPISLTKLMNNDKTIPAIGDPEVKIKWDIKTCPPFIPYNGTPALTAAPTTGKMQQFETGATRDSDEGKVDPEGALSPIALEAYMEYMADCRVCSDGTLRDSDNWQKGIPLTKYMKSLWRHFFDVWKLHRGHKVFDKKTKKEITMKTALCALMFNTMGYLHEWLKKENNGTN